MRDGQFNLHGRIVWVDSTEPLVGDGLQVGDLWVDTFTPTTKRCTSISPVAFDFVEAVGGAGGAPTGATYITQTPNGGLTNEQALSTLATGIVKNTTATGVLSIAVGDTDYTLPATTDLKAPINNPVFTGTLNTHTIPGGTGTLALTSDITGTNSGTNTGDQNLFRTIAVSGQSDVVADTTTDTLTLVAGTNVTITTDASTDSITINASGGGGGVSDGDKGDITVSGTGTVWTVDNGAITLAKQADMATASIVGRNTAGTGSPEVLSAATTKSLLSLNNVENTALSTWAGTTNVTTVGTVTTGTWNGTDIAVADGGTGVSSTTAYAVQCGGTTSTGAHQAVASVGSADEVLVSNGAGALPSFKPRVDVQVFTSTGAGTWTKPTSFTPTFVEVVCYGAGGGGGAGASLATAVVAKGGAGGGGGARSRQIFLASDLAATEDFSVGAGGTAGTPGVAGAAGGAGGNGGITYFGTGTPRKVVGGGGGGGAGGAISATTTGGGGGGGIGGSGSAGSGAVGNPGRPGPGNSTGINVSGGAGAAGTITVANTNNAEYGGAGGGGSTSAAASNPGGGSLFGGAAGGSGGGHTAAPATTVPSAGGLAGQYTNSGGGTVGTSGASPTAGGAGANGSSVRGGSGGGGGGSTVAASTNGATGGAGGSHGGGGGGGGVGMNPGLGGAGGAGGNGVIYVYSY